jgi:hypothetical protein
LATALLTAYLKDAPVALLLLGNPPDAACGRDAAFEPRERARLLHSELRSNGQVTYRFDDDELVIALFSRLCRVPSDTPTKGQ